MRSLLLLPLLALVACGSPCENLNGVQRDPAMQTCAFDGPVEAGDPFASEDGAPLPAELLMPTPPADPQTLPDGTDLVESYFGVSWSGTGGDLSPSDSASGVESVAVGEGVFALGMRTGGRVLVRSANGETLHQFRVAEGEARSLGIPQANAAVRLAMAGGTLAVADRLGFVAAYDLETGGERWNIEAGARGLAVSPGGALVAAATEDAVRVWNAQTGEPVAEWEGMRRLHGLVFSSDGALLAAHAHGTADRTSSRVTTRDYNDNPSNVARTETYTTAGAEPSVTVWRLPS